MNMAAPKVRDFLLIFAVDVPAYTTISVPATSFEEALSTAEVQVQKLDHREFEADTSEFMHRYRVVSVYDTENPNVNIDAAISGNLVRNQRSDAETDAYQLLSKLLSSRKSNSADLLLEKTDVDALEALSRQLEALEVPGGEESCQPWAKMLPSKGQ